jgi:hypothetical protein
LREIYEFRMYERFASLLSKPSIGHLLDKGVRKVKVEGTDPMLAELGSLHKRLQQTQRHGLISYWEINRRYSEAELASAELFRLFIDRVFEPPGEACGTVYEESSACEICKANSRQVSDLFLDFRKIRRATSLARTIADEFVVSEELASVLLESKVSGLELRPIHHRPNFDDDPFDVSKTPSGKLLLERANAEGVPAGSAKYYLWLREKEPRKLWDAAQRESVSTREARAQRSARVWPLWRQLWIVSDRPSVVAPTRTGINPFDCDQDGQYRCSRGDTIGLRFISEIYVRRDSWSREDIALTRETVGVRRGWLRPAAAILISPRLRRILIDKNVSGIHFEIAHLV